MILFSWCTVTQNVSQMSGLAFNDVLSTEWLSTCCVCFYGFIFLPASSVNRASMTLSLDVTGWRVASLHSTIKQHCGWNIAHYYLFPRSPETLFSRFVLWHIAYLSAHCSPFCCLLVSINLHRFIFLPITKLLRRFPIGYPWAPEPLQCSLLKDQIVSYKQFIISVAVYDATCREHCRRRS